MKKYSLSHYEFIVLYSLSKGMTRKELSKRIQQKPRTLDSHLSKMFKKFGIKRATQLHLWFSENKVVVVGNDNPHIIGRLTYGNKNLGELAT